MTVLEDKDKTFMNFKYALYATDAMSQHINRKSGNHEESKKYYSGKHKLYGYGVEVSVVPNGFAIHCSNHY